MNKAQKKRFDSLYRKHVSALKRQGKAETPSMSIRAPFVAFVGSSIALLIV